MVSLWKHRKEMKNIFGLRSYPSVLNLIAGVKDKKPTLKVFLRHEDEDTKNFFKNRFENVNFVVVSTKSRKEQRVGREREEYSSHRINKNRREQIGKIIKRQGERLFANHSSIVGLGIGNMDSKIPCIIIYCLDKDLIPFGEKPLPKTLEGCACDIREDFVMFGWSCFDCHEIGHPNYGCCIGLPSKRIGSAGFLVKTSALDMEVSGFLTAAHVATEDLSSLYHKKSLLSKLDANRYKRNEIVHPLLPDNNIGPCIGKVRESFCGNWGPEEIGIDAAFVQNYKVKKAGKYR